MKIKTKARVICETKVKYLCSRRTGRTKKTMLANSFFT